MVQGTKCLALGRKGTRGETVPSAPPTRPPAAQQGGKLPPADIGAAVHLRQGESAWKPGAQCPKQGAGVGVP